jgi:hypothetical protein
MNNPEPIGDFRIRIESAIQRQDINGLIEQAEQLMSWQQSVNDEEKVAVATLLDDIAASLMSAREYAAARVIIIGSLRLKGTLGKESGLTTFSYQQLEECEKASDAQGEASLSTGRQHSVVSQPQLLLIFALVAVASVWVFFVLIIK